MIGHDTQTLYLIFSLGKFRKEDKKQGFESLAV